MAEKDKRLSLDLLHAFGSICSNKYTNCVAIIDEDKKESEVVYPCGKYFAKKTIESNQSTYIRLSNYL